MSNGENSAAKELHACRGLNSCAGEGKDETGTKPGDGACATANYHTCGGKNNCKNQGGCGRGPAEMQERPGSNDCKGKAGCAVPITTNVHTDGPSKGRSVWEHARELFEGRMKEAGKEVADAPTSSE